MVFKMGATATLNLTWRNPMPRGEGGTFECKNLRFEYLIGEFPFEVQVDIPLTVNGSTSYSQSVTIPPNGTYTIDPMTITGLPTFVAAGIIRYEATVTSPTGLDGGYSPPWKTYLVFSDPVGFQSVPWTEMLDLSCYWSSGLSTAPDILSANTFGLYYSQLFAYWPAGTPNLPSAWTTDFDEFKLSLFFTFSGPRFGNCVDVSCFNQLSINSLGVGAYTTQVQCIPRFGQTVDLFVTYPVCPIGDDSSNIGSYASITWSMHQVCTTDYVNTVGGGFTKAFDACLAILKDLSGGVYMNPPVDWWLHSYWQTPSGLTSPSFWGLVSRYWYPANTYPNPVDEVAPLKTGNYSLAGVI